MRYHAMFLVDRYLTSRGTCCLHLQDRGLGCVGESGEVLGRTGTEASSESVVVMGPKKGVLTNGEI